VALQEEQLINGIMVSILVYVLCISTGTDALLYLSIWLGKRREREREGELEVSNNNIKGERSRH